MKPAKTGRRPKALATAQITLAVDRAPNYGQADPIDSEAALDAALLMLAARDPEIIPHMIEIGGRPPLRRREAGFDGLAHIIVSQQVSVASADAIFRRLRAAVEPFTPVRLAETSEEALRACGLSIQKIRALRAIAEAITSQALPLQTLALMPAEEAVRLLVAIRGVGPWSADIFLLFCLGHADAWPSGDLALQEAARIALKLESRPDKKALDRIGERWRPHRGVAALLLWSYYRAAKKNRDGIGLSEPKD